MDRISMKTLSELYRVSNKYWRTGDTDILPKEVEIARTVCDEYWSEIMDITRIVTRKHYPVKKLAEVLKVLGFDVEEEDDGR